MDRACCLAVRSAPRLAGVAVLRRASSRCPDTLPLLPSQLVLHPRSWLLVFGVSQDSVLGILFSPASVVAAADAAQASV